MAGTEAVRDLGNANIGIGERQLRDQIFGAIEKAADHLAR
jgi:hypothetical protein